MTLNSNQQQLVADNHGLIAGYAKTHNLDLEDWYGVLAIGLCKAAFYYDESKGAAFSTLAFKCMNNVVWRTYQSNKNNIENNSEILSLDFESADSDGNRCDLGDLIPDINADTERCVTEKITVENFKASLSEREKYIINMLDRGCKSAEIAKELGISRQRCSVLIDRLRKRYCNLFI